MGGSNLPQQQQIPANLTEEQDARRIEKQGMSDQGIVSLGEGVKKIKGAYSDLKKGVIDPAVNAGKKAAIRLLEEDKKMYNAVDDKMIKYLGGTPDEMVVEKMQPMIIKSTEEVFDPILGTKIKGMVSSTGIQQNTSIDDVRYDRNATGSEFKGVKAKASPKKSIFNMTAEEAMKDL
jgi:hypothetical protein